MNQFDVLNTHIDLLFPVWLLGKHSEYGILKKDAYQGAILKRSSSAEDVPSIQGKKTKPSVKNDKITFETLNHLQRTIGGIIL